MGTCACVKGLNVIVWLRCHPEKLEQRAEDSNPSGEFAGARPVARADARSIVLLRCSRWQQCIFSSGPYGGLNSEIWPDRRMAPGTQSPSTTLELRKGTCRDFAVLMIEAARTLGFAARFITGYIYLPDRDGPTLLGGGATHAWCQIYVPGSGWVEFDPTNGIVGNRDLIRVAVARVPSQAIPLFGTYWGDREDELGMNVEVNVKTAVAYL